MKETRRNHPQLLACADTPNMELIFSKKQKIVKPLKLIRILATIMAIRMVFMQQLFFVKVEILRQLLLK
jgi:hypothetical protein